MFERNRILLKSYFSSEEIEKSFIGKTIEVCGWIEFMRSQGSSFAFIKLNDGSCINSLQIIINSENVEDESNFDNIFKRGTKGVSIRAYGNIVESPKDGQLTEMVANKIEVLGDVDGTSYPISKNKLPMEHVRKYLHLRSRTKIISSVQRIRNACSKATHDFFQDQDFSYVHTPIFTQNDCEGAGETFQIKSTLSETDEENNIKEIPFFGKNTSLTVSGQLHGETYACGMGDIYTFGPTFRAEDSHTTRHLAEFWMIEPEMCFINLNDLMDISEDYVKYCIYMCLQKTNEEIKFLTNEENNLLENLSKYIQEPFARVSYTEAIECLLKEIEDSRAIVRDKDIPNKKFKKIAKGKHIFENEISWGIDMASEHEKYLTDKIYGKPVIVYNYPKKIKSFYMKSNREEDTDRETVQAMDLLVPNIGELIGGSMREDNYDRLNEIMKEKSIEIDWYLDLRKYGSVPHGGFGMGFERLILLITGIQNIRDVIPYPRYPKHCSC